MSDDIKQQQLNKQQGWNPYVGPRPFNRDSEEQSLFFGRKYETERIISLIYSHKLVLVYAQSGAGKTSLFNASITPALEQKGLEVLPLARVGIGSNTSSTDLVDSTDAYDSSVSISDNNPYLHNAFQSLMATQNHGYNNSLRSKSLSDFLLEYFHHEMDNQRRGRPIPQLLVFDQLEEIFNLYVDPNRWYEQQVDFFKQVTDALEKDPLLRIVFVIREDYLAQLDSFSKFLPEKLKPRFRLERLHKDAALEAVRGPLEKAKSFIYDERLIAKIFEEGIIDKLIEDLLKIHVETFGSNKYREIKGEFVEPIQLQVVCQRLWIKLISSKIDQINQKFFIHVGDVDKALEDFYVDAICESSKKTGTDEKTIRKWFEEKLITSSGTRSIVHRGHEFTGGMPNKVVDILENKYILRKEERSGAQWYELTHDRLIKPVKESNKKWYYQKTKLRRLLLRKRIIIPIMVIILLGFLILINNFNLQQKQIENQLTLVNLLNKGLALDSMGNHTGALQYYDSALAKDPTNVDALLNKGLALDSMGNHTGALQYYDRALAKDPTNVDALLNKGLALDSMGNHTGALQYYDRALAKDPTNVDALLNKGLALYKLGNYAKALQYYDRALAKDPTNVDALFNGGLALYKLGNYAKALQYYDRALAKDPTNVDALFNGGLALYKLGNYAKALQYYDRALAKDQNYINALNNRGLALDSMGNYSEVIKHYFKALSLDSMGNHTGALQYYDRALAKDPTNVDALFNKGLALDSMGNHTGALQYYDRALAKDQNYINALNNRGLALYKLGNYAEALQYYDRALAKDPNDTIIKNNKQLAQEHLYDKKSMTNIFNNNYFASFN